MLRKAKYNCLYLALIFWGEKFKLISLVLEAICLFHKYLLSSYYVPRSGCILPNERIPLCGTYDLGRTPYIQLLQCVICIHASVPSATLSLLHGGCSQHTNHIYTRVRAPTQAHILRVALSYSSNFKYHLHKEVCS